MIWQSLIILLNRKSYIGIQLAYLYFTFSHFKGQGHVHFDCKYVYIFTANILQMMKDRTNITNAIRESHMGFIDWHIYLWPWHILKVKRKVMHFLIANI